jgi:hypothetical protein
MSRPYEEVNPGEPILAADWNSVQADIREHILTHTHAGTGESGAQIDIAGLASGADIAARKLSASESLTVGSSSQPLLSVNPAATNQEGNYQVNVAGTLRADQVRAGRLDGVTSLAVGDLAVSGPTILNDSLTVGGVLTTTGAPLLIAGATVVSDKLMLSDAPAPIWQAQLEVALPTTDDATKALVIGKGSTNYLTVLNNGNVGIGVSPSSAVHVAVDKSVRIELGANQKLSLGGNGTLEVDAPNVFGGRFTVAENGNVGIGVAEPGAKLEVRGAVRFGDGGGAGQLVAGAASIGLRDAANNERLTILQNSGNVGIGLTDPGAKLEVRGAIRFGDGAGAGGLIAGATYVALRDNSNAERLAILQANGNVGVGTTAPGARLAVSGTDATVNIETAELVRLLRPAVANVKNTNSAGLRVGAFETGVSGRTRLDIVVAGAPNGDNAWGSVPNLAVMTLLGNGNVGVDTTSPASKLHIDKGRVDITTSDVTGGGQNRFNGLAAWNEQAAFRRGQLVLSSSFSDLVIASSHVNDNHGSTLTFASYNPADANDYRKWVINQGNWGLRKQFLDFGYADAGGRSNPHSNINTTDTVLTLDGVNKRVGVGANVPGARLDVAGVGDTAGQISLQLRSGNSSAIFNSNQITFGYGNTAQYRHAIKTRHHGGQSATNAIDFYVWRYGTDTADGIGSLHTMTLDGGNVGIGTTSPGNYKLNVQGGSALLSGNVDVGNFQPADRFLTLKVEGGNKYRSGVRLWAWQENYGYSIEHDERDAGLYFKNHNVNADGSTVMVIKGGNVGIGTTDPAGQRLKVQGGNLHCTGKVYAEGGLVFYWGPDRQWKVLDNRSGSVAGTVADGGPSDLRFKTDVRPLRNALDKVLQLQGAVYRWSETGLNYFTRDIAQRVSAGPDATAAEEEQLWSAEREKAHRVLAGESIGLIAQAVERVVPEVVHDDAEGYKYIRYQQLTALLVEAIKEQNALIQTLATRMARLETA